MGAPSVGGHLAGRGRGSRSAAAQAPIKIGFLSPLSGAIAQAGKDMYSGCELYWQEHGMQIAGRKLEVILEDTEGQPATAVSKLRKLIDSDHVNLLAGVILSTWPTRWCRRSRPPASPPSTRSTRRTT